MTPQSGDASPITGTPAPFWGRQPQNGWHWGREGDVSPVLGDAGDKGVTPALRGDTEDKGVTPAPVGDASPTAGGTGDKEVTLR